MTAGARTTARRQPARSAAARPRHLHRRQVRLLEGYAGEKCDVPLCPGTDRDMMCSGHGVCDGYACKCDDGWEGADCAQKSCPGGCGSNQFCHDGSCACLPGFTGVALGCTLKTCAGDCGMHGKCNNGTCLCDPGFGGADCSEHSCPVTGIVEDGVDPSGLHGDMARFHSGGAVHGLAAVMAAAAATGARIFGGGGGVVAAETAVTPIGAIKHNAPFTGLVCSGRGECVSGVCKCEAGYTSNDCSARSCVNDCSGHGKCNVDGDARAIPAGLATTARCPRASETARARAVRAVGASVDVGRGIEAGAFPAATPAGVVLAAR